MMRRTSGLLSAGLTALVVIGTSGMIAMGCSAAMGGGAGSDFGATPGGVQDVSLARELVELGQVPPAEAFVVEGMFSEHDLPLEGAPCSRTLCLKAALGLAPDASGADAAWAQVGTSSSIDVDDFEPPSLTLIATVDVSSSMGWDYGEDQPGQLARALLGAIADELRAEDRIAIVTYGSNVTTALEIVSGTDGRIDGVINNLDEGGSTNMEGGLERAFSLGRSAVGSTDEVRVLLFTDVQPNVGATSTTEFERMVAAAAGHGVGITVLGLGAGLGQELFDAMSTLRGGNAFSLMGSADVSTFMADNWPWAMCPIAYDMTMTVTPTANLDLVATYGFPGAESATSLEVATVFLSKRRGALLFELSPGQTAIAAGDGVTIDLSYEELSGVRSTETLSALHDGSATDARGHYAPQASVAKTIALALLVSGMHAAADLYGSDQAGAVALLEPVLECFAADATAIADPDIDVEAAFWPRLLELMESGATQGNLYGGY